MLNIKYNFSIMSCLSKYLLLVILICRFEVLMWEDNENLPSEEEFCERVKGFHGIYTFGPQKVTKKMLDAAGEFYILLRAKTFVS